MTNLQGKVAVITGGAGGIGRALGRRLGHEGMKVVLADVLADPLREATRALTDEGIEAAGVVTDVTDYSSVEALAKEALRRFGAVDVVCNNAGTGAVSEGYLWEHDLADWRWGIDVNVLGVIHGLKAFVPILLERGEGHVVNTCSGNGGFAPIARGAMGGPATAVYPMTKAAVLCLTESLYTHLEDDRDAGAGARAVPRRVFEHRHLGVVAASTAALRPDPATPHARADAGQGGGPVRGRRRPRRVHPAGDGGRPGGGRHCGGPVLDDGPARAVRRRRAPQGGIDPFPRRPGLPGRRSRPQRRRKLRNARRKPLSSNVIRYGPRPPEAQIDHEIDATKAPIATEAVTVTYLTEPEIVAAVLPKPLQPADEPLVRIQLQRVRIEGMAPFGSAVFSVTARHGDRYGDYPLFMPQSTEQSVTGGRETFGEPKKLAQITVERDGDRVTAGVDRLGYRLIRLSGQVSGPAELPPDQMNTEFYFKFLRAPDGSGITDPHLVYGEYHRHYELLENIDGTLKLGESPLDPVADIVIRQVTSITWCRRRTVQVGRIAARVPQEWLLPYVHQRYDDVALLAAPRPEPARA